MVDHEPADPSASSSHPPDVGGAVASFLALGDADRAAASGAVYENYRGSVEAAGDVEELPVGGPTQVWDFVRPGEIFVSRRYEDRDVYVQVLCECAWEGEHGLQLVFRRGDELVRVSAQDGHLTDADAYGLPED